jgi:hypothetical protein
VSGWLINIDLPFDRVAQILQRMPGATSVITPSRITLTWEDDTSLEGRDATPDAGTDMSVFDFTERRGWIVFDFLVERTTADIWMMDGGGLLLSGRGVTPEELGLDLAADRLPAEVICRDDDGETYEWSPLKNKRDGILVEDADC